MKKKRTNRLATKIIGATLAFVMCFSSYSTAFAADVVTPTDDALLPVCESSSVIDTSISPLADIGWYYKEVKVDSKTAVKVPIGYAGGQPLNGTVFPNTTSGFYWNDGGYNVSVSISVGYGPMSVSVSCGSTGGTGYYVNAPIANKAVKLYIYKDLTTTRYKLYKVYYSGQQQFLNYTYKTVPTRNYFTIDQYPFDL
jgi:hypothetical protein